MESKKRTGNRRQSLTKLNELCDELNERDEELKRAEQLFKIILDESPFPVLIWTTDMKLRITKVLGNSNSILVSDNLRTPTKWRGKKIHEFLRIEDDSCFHACMHEEALNGKCKSTLHELNNSIFLIRCRALHNLEKNIIGVRGIAWDLSEFYKLKDHLEETDDILLLKPFKKNIFHERIKESVKLIKTMFVSEGE